MPSIFFNFFIFFIKWVSFLKGLKDEFQDFVLIRGERGAGVV